MPGRIRLAVLTVLFAFTANAEVRPLSDAERAAVELAAAYLSGGPAAIESHLAATSPMRRAPANERAAEIEARLGPPAEAQWDLQTVVPALKDRLAVFTVTYPAGFEDHLIFEMVPENGAYKLRDVRFLAQPSEKKPFFPPRPAVATEAARATSPAIPLPALLGLTAAVLGIVSAFLARRRAVAISLLTIGIAGAGAAAFLSATHGAPAEIATAPAALVAGSGSDLRLAPLLPLRRALADGKSDFDQAYAALDRAQGRGRIADLWKIQSQLLRVQTDAAKRSLADFPSPSDTPLAEILRAQVALMENDQVTAALAFERAVSLGPGRDALWRDNADILYAMGFESRAKSFYQRLERMGSRDADSYYTLATLSAAAGDETAAEQYLRQAWLMAPVARRRLVGTPVLWSTLRRPGMLETVSISAATEPLVAASVPPVRPIVLPPDAQATTIGNLLRIVIGQQELRVPQGASVAPPNTRIAEATESAADDAARRIADLPVLLNVGTSAAAYAQPALRQRITGTAYALAERNRWADIVTLTDSLSPAAEHVPPDIFYLRTVALQRLHRGNDASRLLTAVIQSPVLQRRRDAVVMAQFAELFAAQDLFDAAVKMYDKSQEIRPNPFIDDRVRQILMNKRLATKYSQAKTEHFEIRYPEDVSPASAMQLGSVLEREYQRLQTWIPTPVFQPVVVNMVWWQEFRATYTQNDFVLGFFNGKITVPFAGVDAEVPELKAILAHELAHAMIAQVTADQAPRWFQEGYARRVEGRSFHENAFNMYDDGKLLPISLLDAVLQSSPDPELISAGYIIAQTDIRFLEDRYGRNSLQRFMAAFREGATTEEAAQRVCGKSLSQLEVELRQWGRKEQRVFTDGGAR